MYQVSYVPVKVNKSQDETIATSRRPVGWSEETVMADTYRYVEAVNWTALKDFTVTEEHLKLPRHVHLYWDYGEGYGAPAINPKRPYGGTRTSSGRSLRSWTRPTATGKRPRTTITSISPPRPRSASPACTSRR